MSTDPIQLWHEGLQQSLFVTMEPSSGGKDLRFVAVHDQFNPKTDRNKTLATYHITTERFGDWFDEHRRDGWVVAANSMTATMFPKVAKGRGKGRGIIVID
jgi:hypothetical protein